MSILVAGGAGYIGAHVVRLLLERGEEVVVVDDLSYGTPERVKGASLVELDVASGQAPQTLAEVMDSHGVTAVIHFAARKQVGESVARPAWYYQQNIGGMANVLAAMEDAGVDQMIFSSSAAVYGMPPVEVVPEDIDCRPINPYGETKLIGEWMMADCERAWDLKWIGLRYFNVAGAGWDDLGDMATLNLIPMVLDRLAKGETPKIFGTDYPTPDGTCIRDYIHVRDLAVAGEGALAAGDLGQPARTRPVPGRQAQAGRGRQRRPPGADPQPRRAGELSGRLAARSAAPGHGPRHRGPAAHRGQAGERRHAV